jgi:hypothetical protein
LIPVFGSWLADDVKRVADLALERLAAWSTGPKSSRDWFAWSGAGEPLWKSFLSHWPDGERVENIVIVSPFWSEEDGPDAPLSRLLSELKARDALAPGAKVRLLTEARNVGDGILQPVLPATFASAAATVEDARIQAEAVDPSVSREETSDEGLLVTRALHAKVVLFEGPSSSLAYLGSANFSRHGWGFLPERARANVEAGLILLRAGEERAELRALVPKTIGEPVELGAAAAGRIALPEAGEVEPPWPGFIKEACLAPDPERPERVRLEITVFPELVAGPFAIDCAGETQQPPVVLLESGAPEVGTQTYQVDLAPDLLQRLLQEQQVLVRWWQSEQARPFPLNLSLAARESFPIVPDSAKPGESLLLAYYQGRIALEDLYPDPESALGSDPGEDEKNSEIAENSAVDTSRIQSYQVREFVEALRGIRDDLRRATQGTPAAMRLALHGPVSPVALARSVRTEVDQGRRTAMAGAFQLVEILCCLFDARSFEAPERDAAAWAKAVGEAIDAVEALLEPLRARPELASAGDSFSRYVRTLRKHYSAVKGNR